MTERKFPVKVKDEKTGKMVDVDYRGRKLYCLFCHSYDCEHVIVASSEEGKGEGHPDVRKRLERAKKTPKLPWEEGFDEP